MSKKDGKYYICLHETCSFKTDKRKAIYTHLVRTHSERKEDYECEYCNKVFERDTDIEQHLHVHHPQQAFTYTCVSRIENVIGACAKLGSESKDSKKKSVSNCIDSNSSPSTPITTTNVRQSPVSAAPKSQSNNEARTKASVNASLNSIAKSVKTEKINEDCVDDEFEEVDSELEDDIDGCSDEDAPTYVSEPSGLKIKLSLKKGKETSTVEPKGESPCSPPPALNKPNLRTSTAAATRQTRVQAVGNAQVRDKASKYYDKLEVYHSTDSFGRRCCPFCDYKTSKNTIRVHLSGIHKIHFVKCSLCDYKAAFPHQITQHGLKFHKTTNLNVIQLSKEFREKVIEQLKKKHNISNVTVSGSEADDSAQIEDEDFNSEESYPSSADETQEPDVTNEPADDRVFKAPICQTSKTDYYRIQYENGVYLYSCNLCSFKTPVRATIYTHKYRHEEKSYQCGYCDFTSAPRYNRFYCFPVICCSHMI